MTDERKTPRTDRLLQWHGYKTTPPLEQRYEIVCSYLLKFELELAEATAELEKWRNGGVTEELLRKNNGAIRVGRGCVIVSAAEYDQLKSDAKAMLSGILHFQPR